MIPSDFEVTNRLLLGVGAMLLISCQLLSLGPSLAIMSALD